MPTNIKLKPADFPIIVPTRADPEFAALPILVRHDVLTWVKRLQGIWLASPIVYALEKVARRAKMSFAHTRRKYYRLLSARGDWRVLIDRRRVPIVSRTVRVYVPPQGVQVVILAHTDRFALLQIRRNGQPVAANPEAGIAV